MKIHSFIAGGVLLASGLVGVAQANTPMVTSVMVPETVVDIAVSSDVHTTLVAAVVAADLAETLSSE